MGLTNAEWETLCLARLVELEAKIGTGGLPVGLGKAEAKAWHLERVAKPAVAALVELELLKDALERKALGTDARG